MSLKHLLLLFAGFGLYSIFLAVPVYAQINQETFEGVIQRLANQEEIQILGQTQVNQQFEILATSGSLKGRTLMVEHTNIPLSQARLYSPGDKIVLVSVQNGENEKFFITDFVRRDGMIGLAILFVGLTVLVARRKGIQSLFGLLLSFLVIYKGVLPLISAGWPPIGVAIGAAAIIIPITFYLSHGINLKTTIAIIGTLVSLVITGVLAGIFVEWTHLTGFSTEEASFLQIAKGGAFNLKGLILAGIIVGALGILDDVTVSQAAIVLQLKAAAKKITTRELYNRAISVGHDHIGSLVNTLILVYTGAALPLMILFVDAQRPFTELINYEVIAEEIVRTLVASIGLIIAVPITTVLACIAVKRFVVNNKP